MMSITHDLMAALDTSSQSHESSFEDDSLLYEELTSSMLSIERDRDELYRLHDIYTGLEDLRAMASYIPRASIEHVAFFQIAGNLATAGSDYGAPLFFPSLESSVGSTVSTEQLSEAIQRLWQRIVAIFKRLAKAFIAFWNMAQDANQRIRFAAERMKRRAQSAIGRSISNPTIVVKREIDRLSVRGNEPQHGSDIYRGLNLANVQLKVILGSYIDTVLSTGEALITSLGKPTDPEMYLQSAITASKTLRLPFTATALMARDYRDVRFSQGEVQAAPALIGNKTLFITPQGYLPRESPSLLAQAEAARQVGIRLLSSVPRRGGMTLDYEMPTVPATVIQQIAQGILDTTQEIDRFINSASKRKLSQVDKRLLDTVGTAKNKIYAGSITQSDGHHYESAFRFSTTFSAWAQNPHDGLVTHLLGVCRAALVVGNKSLSQHR